MALRLGFIGVGGIAQRHLGNAAARKDVQVVGHADIRLERAQEAAAKYGGNAYDHCAKLLAAEKPQAVVICTSPDAHGDIEEACAERRIPFFVEKPVAVSLALAARAKRAVDSSGITTQVGYMYRFSKGVLKAKELLSTRKVAMVQQHFYMPGLPDRDWWPFIERSGGQLTEQSTHMLDLGRFLCGEVVSVSARTTRAHDWTPRPDSPRPGGLLWVADPFTIPDTTAMTMQYASGALGTLSCSMVPGTAWDAGFRIVADGLIVTIDGGNVSWRGQEQGSLEAGDNWPSYVLYDFLDAVIEGRPAKVPYDEGVRSLAISVAGYASVARDGRPANVPRLLRGIL
jgi:predicted dehydrogenase